MKLQAEDILVDESDRWMVEGGSWWLAHEERQSGTVIGKLLGQTQPLHSFLLHVPTGLVIDHINRTPLDNRRKNLRVVTVQANNMNRYSHNVSYSRTCYRIQIKYRTERYFKSGFKTFEAATTHAKVIKLQFLICELAPTRQHNQHLTDNEYYQLI